MPCSAKSEGHHMRLARKGWPLLPAGSTPWSSSCAGCSTASTALSACLSHAFPLPRTELPRLPCQNGCSLLPCLCKIPIKVPACPVRMTPRFCWLPVFCPRLACMPHQDVLPTPLRGPALNIPCCDCHVVVRNAGQMPLYMSILGYYKVALQL